MSKENFKEKENKNQSRVQDGGLTTGQTGLLIISHQITLTCLMGQLEDLIAAGHRICAGRSNIMADISL
jgi:hypothetical protein